MVVPERHAYGGMADPDAGRPRRNGAEKDLGGAHVRVLDQRMVLHCPDGVEPHLLGEHGLLEAVPDRLALDVGRPELDLGLEDHGELHGAPPVVGPL